MTKPDPYHLFRPIQYLDLADQFYKRPPPFSWPRYFLLCHSIELALKAYLAKLGATLEQLKWDFGHKLDRLVDEAAKKGLPVTTKNTGNDQAPQQSPYRIPASLSGRGPCLRHRAFCPDCSRATHHCKQRNSWAGVGDLRLKPRADRDDRHPNLPSCLGDHLRRCVPIRRGRAARTKSSLRHHLEMRHPRRSRNSNCRAIVALRVSPGRRIWPDQNST
jgi:hypothetical protein